MDNTARTAIVRRKPSLPCRILKHKGLIQPPVLDFGSGRGFDAKYLGADAYDPCYSNTHHSRTYKTILCSYVLNVIEQDFVKKTVLKSIDTLLAPWNSAFITVRSDIDRQAKAKGWKKRGVGWVTRSGTYQEEISFGDMIVLVRDAGIDWTLIRLHNHPLIIRAINTGPEL